MRQSIRPHAQPKFPARLSLTRQLGYRRRLAIEGALMAEGEYEGLPQFTVRFFELGKHEDGGPRGRSYYDDEIDEELQRLGLGEVVGGGMWLDGSGCDIHIVVRAPEAALRVIREVLRRLGAPASTSICGATGESAVYE